MAVAQRFVCWSSVLVQVKGWQPAVPVSNERAGLGVNSGTLVKVPRLMAWRSMIPEPGLDHVYPGVWVRVKCTARREFAARNALAVGLLAPRAPRAAGGVAEPTFWSSSETLGRLVLRPGEAASIRRITSFPPTRPAWVREHARCARGA